jgi:hypothetical protein
MPPVHPAAAVDLPDGAEVIGVVVERRARAYLLTALAPVDHHVVNDLVGATPVTVTFCDQTRCVRVFTDEARGRPLDVWLGGYKDGGLLLRVGGVYYYQASGEVPLKPEAAPLPHRRLAHELATWKVWRQAHPETEVYTGK